MKRCPRFLAILALLALLIAAIWAALALSRRPASQESFKGTLASAVTNTVSAAKARFTGGVGAILMAGATNGAILINGVLPGSPAEKAGLQTGDRILQVNGVSTQGRPLAQVVDDMRGLAVGSVRLIIQRGSTNLECVIHRSSWKNLGIPK